MQRAIITGADGFVGSNTVKYFLEQGVEVLAIDLAQEPKRLTAFDKMKYVSMDLSLPEKLLEIVAEGEYDTFIHFAWAGSAGDKRFDCNLQTKNALDTVECLKVAKKIGCKRFVCAGSIMEYEIEMATHAQETKPGLGYIYASGKLLAHNLCKSVAASIGIDLLWPMITNAYGVGEISPRFVNTTLRKMINKEPLQFTSATQNYDFVYITDVAKAFYLVSKFGKPFCEYMIGSGNARPLKEFIKEMQQECAPEQELLFGDVKFTGTNMPLSTFSTENIEMDCGFKAEVTFAKGTRMTMNWLINYTGGVLAKFNRFSKAINTLTLFNVASEISLKEVA